MDGVQVGNRRRHRAGASGQGELLAHDDQGDYGTNPSECPPKHSLGVDGKRGQCPESFGILQVRYAYSGPPAGRATWPEVEESTAYNLDFAYAYWRSCYEGDLTWLNTVDRGGEYAAGDAWGCVGTWFSGRWYTQPANEYIDAVRAYATTRVWTTSSFINAR
jgi:autotransporter family porin